MIALQLAINGILLGGVLALSALGFNIIFGVMRVVNLAHGDFVVLAAVMCAYAFTQFGINPLLLLPVTIVFGFVAGALVHRFLLRRLPREIASAEASMASAGSRPKGPDVSRRSWVRWPTVPSAAARSRASERT